MTTQRLIVPRTWPARSYCKGSERPLVARHGYWHPTGPSIRGSPCARIAVREHGAAGEVNLRRKDGSIVRTAYWVIETTTRAHAYLRLSCSLTYSVARARGLSAG